MTNLLAAYAQAIALHQELERQITEDSSPAVRHILQRSDELVRTIGCRLSEN